MTKAIVGQVSKLETSERSINFLTPPQDLELPILPILPAILAVLAHLSSYLGCAVWQVMQVVPVIAVFRVCPLMQKVEVISHRSRGAAFNKYYWAFRPL